MIVIRPTVGRQVWYRPTSFDTLATHPQDSSDFGIQPLAATIVAVQNDRCVNLQVLDAKGRAHPRTDVVLVHGDEMQVPEQGFAEWMPFQKGQAAKLDEDIDAKARSAVEKHMANTFRPDAAAETRVYADGTTATGPAPLPDASPASILLPDGSEGMTFGAALRHLKDGERVARTGWNGKGMWLELQVPDARSKMTSPYIFLSYPEDSKNTPGARVPWHASQTDVLAEDWMVVS